MLGKHFKIWVYGWKQDIIIFFFKLILKIFFENFLKFFFLKIFWRKLAILIPGQYLTV